jgi:hypothetical protein
VKHLHGQVESPYVEYTAPQALRAALQFDQGDSDIQKVPLAD